MCGHETIADSSRHGLLHAAEWQEDGYLRRVGQPQMRFGQQLQ